MYLAEGNIDFFNNNLIRVYNHFCTVLKAESEYEFFVGPDGSLVAHNKGSGRQLNDYNIKENFEKKANVKLQKTNIYSNMVFMAIVNYDNYDHTHKNCYFKFLRVMMRLYKYVFLGQSVIKEDPTFKDCHYNLALFNWNTLLRDNPGVFFQVEGKNLLERLYDEIPEFEKTLQKYYFEIHDKEARVGGEEKIYFERVGKITEMELDFNGLSPKLEYSVDNEVLVEYIQNARELENQYIIQDSRFEFDRIFEELIKMINIRYYVTGYHEEPHIFYNPDKSDKFYKKNVKYNGIIITQSYRDMFLIYEYLHSIVDTYKDVHYVPVYIEEVKNYHKISYKDLPYRFLQVLISKEIFYHKSYFEIKVFHANHYDYYEIDHQVWNYEKERRVKFYEDDYALYKRYWEAFIFPIVDPGEVDYGSWDYMQKEQIEKLVRELEFNINSSYYQKYFTKDKENDKSFKDKENDKSFQPPTYLYIRDLVYKLERLKYDNSMRIVEKDILIDSYKQKDSAYNKYYSQNFNLIKNSYLMQLMFTMAFIIIGISLMINYRDLNTSIYTANKNVLDVLVTQNAMITDLNNLESLNLSQVDSITPYGDNLSLISYNLYNMINTSDALKENAITLYNLIVSDVDTRYVNHTASMLDSTLDYTDILINITDASEDTIIDYITATQTDFDTLVETAEDSVDGSIDTMALTLISSMDLLYKNTVDHLHISSQDLSEKIDKQIEMNTRIYNAVVDGSMGFASRITDYDSTILASLTSYYTQIDSSLGDSSTSIDSVTSAFDNDTDGLKQRISSYHTTSVSDINLINSSTTDLTDTTRLSIVNYINYNSDESKDYFSDKDTNILNNITDTKNQLISDTDDYYDTIENKIILYKDTLTDTTNNYYDSLETKYTNIHAKVDSTYDSVNTLKTTIDTKTDNIKTNQDSYNTAILNLTDSQYSTLDSYLDTADDNINDHLTNLKSDSQTMLTDLITDQFSDTLNTTHITGDYYDNTTNTIQSYIDNYENLLETTNDGVKTKMEADLASNKDSLDSVIVSMLSLTGSHDSLYKSRLLGKLDGYITYRSQDDYTLINTYLSQFNTFTTTSLTEIDNSLIKEKIAVNNYTDDKLANTRDYQDDFRFVQNAHLTYMGDYVLANVEDNIQAQATYAANDSANSTDSMIRSTQNNIITGAFKAYSYVNQNIGRQAERISVLDENLFASYSWTPQSRIGTILTYLESLDFCSNLVGTAEHTGSWPCKCGVSLCSSSTTLCTQSSSTCSTLYSCTYGDGITANSQTMPCSCNGTLCQSGQNYCNTTLSTCA